jgi:ABC-type sugar transport system ATPase subunit
MQAKRDGAIVESRPVAGITAAGMIRHMVRREVTNVFPRTPAAIGAPVLRVEGQSNGRHFRDVGLEARRGKIIRLTGLVVAGRTEFACVLFVLERPVAGRILIDGKPVAIGTPAEAVRAGVAYVREDRTALGIVPAMNIRENICLPILRRISQAGRIGISEDQALARRYVHDLGISPADPKRRISPLSGGNQQKAAIAKWRATKPSVLILDEATRGADVGAKAELHRILGELVAQGLAVVAISPELLEVIGVCDRVLVLRDGEGVALLDRADLTDARIMDLATGKVAA